MHDPQVVAAPLQVLQGEVQAEHAAPVTKYPLAHAVQVVAFEHEVQFAEQAEQVLGVAVVTKKYPLLHPLALQVVVVPDETVQVLQFEGQARQAFELTMYPEAHKVQLAVAAVQVKQLVKQAVQVGAVPKNPLELH